MPPGELATVGLVQQAITTLLQTREPAFWQIGWNLFRSFAVIILTWQGVTMAFRAYHGLPDQLFEFVKLVMFIAFGLTMIRYYDAPLWGLSFSNLITDQAATLSNILDARALDNVFRHLDALWARFILPDTWGIAANLMYWLLLIVITLAKAFSLGVVSYGLIASAVCALVGPIFIPFFLIPQLDWLFWGWLKSFVQYAFMQVIAMAWLMVGESFVFRFVSGLPPGITEAQYPLYLLSSLVVVGTFAFGILAVPFLTSSLFSGHAHQGAGGFMAVLTRK